MKKYAGHAFSALFYLVIFIFLIWYVKQLDLSTLKSIEIRYSMIIAASVTGLLFRLWGAFTWLRILGFFGSSKSGIELYYVYAKAWLGRYIPGKLPWILGKIYFASKFNISKAKLGVSSLLEGALQILSALILGSILLLISGELDLLSNSMKIFAIMIVLILSFILHPKVFNKATSFAYRAIKKKRIDPENHINGLIVAKSFGLFSTGFLLSGLSYFFLTKSLVPDLSFTMLPYIIGLFNVSGAIGMISFFAPSGIGVRDGVQLFFLNQTFTPEIALVIVALARLWSFIIDVLFFALLYIAKSTIALIASRKSNE